MTTTINASTSSGLVVTPDNSGNVLLQYNGVSTPLFFATCSGGQTTTAGANNKLQFDTELYDTASCYNTSTYRFTPTVAGFYQVNLNINFTNPTIVQPSIWKNGSGYAQGQYTGSATTYSNGVCAMVYLNGTTDYIEPYAYTSDARTISSNNSTCWFQACLLRGA